MKRYRLYVDESGDHTYKNLDDPARRYLCLLGLFVESETYRTRFHPDLEKLKQTHFPHSPDDPVVLHRAEVINKRHHFARLQHQENEAAFNRDYLEFLTQQDYTIIGAVIDKKSHVGRYGDAAYHPYHYCLAALLERYCGFLNFFNAEGDVLAESRGGAEDTQLKAAYQALYRGGTYYRNASSFQQVLTSRELKLKSKSANVAGLQVADLLAYPVKQEILLEKKLISDPGEIFSKQVCRAISRKYNRHFYQGRIEGYGKVFLA